MIQFYFLSIFFNAAAGYMLIRDNNKKEQPPMEDHGTEGAQHWSTQNDTLRLILGILSVITGLFKLLSAVQGDVPVIGDLIPALFGFATGFILIFEYHKKTAVIDLDKHILLELFLVQNKRRIGFLAIGSAILHFLFPQALLI
jgi:hypothetical protein